MRAVIQMALPYMPPQVFIALCTAVGSFGCYAQKLPVFRPYAIYAPAGSTSNNLTVLSEADRQTKLLTVRSPFFINHSISYSDIEPGVRFSFRGTSDLVYTKGGKIFDISLDVKDRVRTRRVSNLTDACEVGVASRSSLTTFTVMTVSRSVTGKTCLDPDRATSVAVKLEASPEEGPLLFPASAYVTQFRDPAAASSVAVVRESTPVTRLATYDGDGVRLGEVQGSDGIASARQLFNAEVFAGLKSSILCTNSTEIRRMSWTGTTASVSAPLFNLVAANCGLWVVSDETGTYYVDNGSVMRLSPGADVPESLGVSNLSPTNLKFFLSRTRVVAYNEDTNGDLLLESFDRGGADKSTLRIATVMKGSSFFVTPGDSAFAVLPYQLDGTRRLDVFDEKLVYLRTVDSAAISVGVNVNAEGRNYSAVNFCRSKPISVHCEGGILFEYQIDANKVTRLGDIGTGSHITSPAQLNPAAEGGGLKFGSAVWVRALVDSKSIYDGFTWQFGSKNSLTKIN